MPAPPRQTISYLKQRFSEVGIRPDTHKGQNFLIDLNLVELLADSAELGPDDVVLEVGSGTGSLTAMMAARAAHVVSVEIDPALAQLAREELIDLPNVTLLEQDALKNKNHLHPVVLDEIQRHLDAEPGRRFKLAANLPYNVATPIISNLLSTPMLPATMTVTIQRELAERMCAVPSTKDYSALSIWVQSQCDIEIVRLLPPSVFWPRPKIDSAIIRITVDTVRRAAIANPEFFHRFVRSMFFHRRKFLRSELISVCKGHLDKMEVDQIMHEMHLGPDARAEQLDVATMLALSELVHQRTDGAVLGP